MHGQVTLLLEQEHTQIRVAKSCHSSSVTELRMPHTGSLVFCTPVRSWVCIIAILPEKKKKDKDKDKKIFLPYSPALHVRVWDMSDLITIRGVTVQITHGFRFFR